MTSRTSGSPAAGEAHGGGAAPRVPSRDEYRAAAALRAGLRRFSQASDRVLRAESLTNERYELLLTIADRAQRDVRTTVSDLTEELGVAQASVTQLVRRAQDAGLLQREVATDDARIRYITLTELGARQLEHAVGALAEERSRLTALLQDVSADSP